MNETEEISTQRINLILKTVFELLWFEPEGLYVSQIVDYLKKSIPFTDYETGYYSFAPYLPRYEVIMRAGTIPLVKSGWMEKTKNGRWFITSTGRSACHKYRGSEDFFKASIELFYDWKNKEDQRLALFESDPFNSARELATEQIRQYLEMLDIREIRVIVASLLKALGYHIAWSAPIQEDDSAIDMICTPDPLGLKPPRLVVHIGNSTKMASMINIDQYSKLLRVDDVGLFISLGGFVDGVGKYSLEATQPAIRCMDLEKFIELWVANSDKIDQAGAFKLPLRPIPFLNIPGKARYSLENKSLREAI